MTAARYSRRSAFRLGGALVAAALVAGLACHDAATSPVADSRLAPRDRASDWACAGSDGYWNCYWFEAENQSSTPWTPPPDWGQGLVGGGGGGGSSGSYCYDNPTACGVNYAGGGPSDASAFEDNTGLPTTTDDVDPNDAANDARFDCRFVRCPTPSEIVNSSNVQSAAAVLIQYTQRDGTEWGAWLYLNADGTIRVGPFLQGTATTMPDLLTAPNKYVIGSIHTHPPGSGPGLSPQDMNSALNNGVYFIVRTVNNIYYYPGSVPGAWSGRVRTPHNCC